jgi:hypothetical protein
MNSTTPLTVNKPSDFYLKVVEGLKSGLVEELDVQRYAKFGTEEVKGVQVYVEFSDFKGTARSPDGRKGKKFEIHAHCVVSRAEEDADLLALDLSSAIHDIVENNHWSLKQSVDTPQNLSAGEGLSGLGEKGFEGWDVSWHQTIYIGETELIEEVGKAIRFTFNPTDENDFSEYEPLEVSDAKSD